MYIFFFDRKYEIPFKYLFLTLLSHLWLLLLSCFLLLTALSNSSPSSWWIAFNKCFVYSPFLFYRKPGTVTFIYVFFLLLCQRPWLLFHLILPPCFASVHLHPPVIDWQSSWPEPLPGWPRSSVHLSELSCHLSVLLCLENIKSTITESRVCSFLSDFVFFFSSYK